MLPTHSVIERGAPAVETPTTTGIPQAASSRQRAPGDVCEPPIKIDMRAVSFWYSSIAQALWDVTLRVPEQRVTALIGPSGCGKSTLLRLLNRMNDLVTDSRVQGTIALDGVDIYGRELEVEVLRRRVGMVFQRPNPFPKSIFENVAFGPRIQGQNDKRVLAEIVQTSLERGALWDEVKDRLDDNANGLSGGQQQRLCIARALATEPEVLLMDEPCSALDPVSTAKIEDLIFELKDSVTIVIVTHNMQQAARVSDRTAFMLHGRMLEDGATDSMFTNPQQKETEDYITGRFG